LLKQSYKTVDDSLINQVLLGLIVYLSFYSFFTLCGSFFFTSISIIYIGFGLKKMENKRYLCLKKD